MSYITLLSDFGLQDASVAVAKGMLLQHAPQSSIIDISHEVLPFNIQQAAYLLSAAYRKFPAGTCHIALFDIFSDATPRLVLTAYDGHYFLSPDNGLMPLAFTDQVSDGNICFELQKDQKFNDWLTAAGKTAHMLQSTPAAINQLQPCTLKRRTATVTANDNGIIKCNVLHIDHFGNVVTDIKEEHFHLLRNDRRFRIVLMQVEEVTEISKNYSDVREGNKLCRFNSNGYLEICVNRGKASSLFGFRPNSKLNDIKIIFE